MSSGLKIRYGDARSLRIIAETPDLCVGYSRLSSKILQMTGVAPRFPKQWQDAGICVTNDRSPRGWTSI